MTSEEWESLHFFRPEENWGDSSLMDYSFLKALDAFRGYINSPIIINYGTQGNHVQNSNHAKGMAVDCVIPGLPLIDAMLEAFRFPFTGIGIYSQWKVPGFHLELVSSESLLPKKLWMGINGPNGQYYIALNWQNIKDYCK